MRRSFQPYLLTVGLGIAGGLLALLLSFPIPWMLGSLIACALARWAGWPVKTRNLQTALYSLQEAPSHQRPATT